MPNLKEKAKAVWAAVRGDGCTDVPDFTPKYSACCNRHDADYTTGTNENGTRISRAQADKRLHACLRKNGETWFGRNVLSHVYYIGVRVFGGSHWQKEKD